jgi:preprotein translocase subunit SecE
VSQTRSDAEDLDGAPQAVEPQDAAERTKAASGKAVKDRAAKKDRKASASAKKTAPRKKRTSPALFYRQIVAELRKVVWPTRTELFTYTSVVIVFVLCIIGIVALIDFGLTRAVQAVFG